jgi:hypothetical protein
LWLEVEDALTSGAHRSEKKRKEGRCWAAALWLAGPVLGRHAPCARGGWLAELAGSVQSACFIFFPFLFFFFCFLFLS